MKFKIINADMDLKAYRPILEDFSATDIGKRPDRACEITVDSLDDLIKLGRAVNNQLILDVSLDPPEICIYDYFIE